MEINQQELYYNYFWQDFETDCKYLANQLKNNINTKEYIFIGIARGGLVLLSKLSYLLPFKDIKTLYISNYDKQENQEYQIKKIKTFFKKENLFNQKILLIDDLIDTGKTMYLIKNVFYNLGAKDIQIAVLINKNFDFKCFSSLDVSHEYWINFPWE